MPHHAVTGCTDRGVFSILRTVRMVTCAGGGQGGGGCTWVEPSRSGVSKVSVWNSMSSRLKSGFSNRPSALFRTWGTLEQKHRSLCYDSERATEEGRPADVQRNNSAQHNATPTCRNKTSEKIAPKPRVVARRPRLGTTPELRPPTTHHSSLQHAERIRYTSHKQ